MHQATSAGQSFVRISTGTNYGSKNGYIYNLDLQKPNEVTLETPDNSYCTTTVGLIFKWQYKGDTWAGVDTYLIQVDDNANFGSINWAGYNADTDYTFTGSLTGETYYWRVKTRDKFGNWNLGTDTAVFYIDTTSPQNIGINIIGDTTASSAVTTTFRASGASSMYVFGDVVDNDSTFQYIAYTETLFLTLSGSSGTKTISVRYKDVAGNVSGDTTDTVILIISGPGNPSISIINNSPTKDTFPVRLLVSADSTATEMYISGDVTGESVNQWTAFDTSCTVALAGASGTRTITVKFRNSGGQESQIAQDDILLDLTAPDTVTLLTVANNTETSNGRPALTWSTVTDGHTVLKYYRIMVSTSSTFSGVYIDTTTVSANYTPVQSLTENTYYWQVLAYDTLLNYSVSASWKLIVDSTAPAGGAISIDTGAIYTRDTSVALVITVPAGATEMQVSEDSSFSGVSWISSAGYKTFSLSSGDGIKYAYARFRDNAKNVSATYTDSIILDMTGPNMNNLNFNPDSGTTTADSTPAVLVWSVAATDSISLTIGGISYYPISDSAETRTFNIVLPYVTNSITVTETDAAGNSAVTDYVLYLDTTAPGNVSISIETGAVSTTKREVVLYIGSDDTTAYFQVSEDSAFTGAAWYGYADTYLFTLSETNGLKYVYVRYMDAMGNVSGTGSDSITLYQPPLPALNLKATPLDNAMVRLDWTASPSSSVVKYYLFWDTATSVMIWDTAIDTTTTVTWTSGTLVKDTWYQYGIRAVDNSGYQDNGYNVAKVMPRDNVSGGTLPSVIIVNPQSGKKLNGNYANIQAEAAFGSVGAIKHVLFQYSTDSGVTWQTMTPHDNANHPNPDAAPTGSGKFITLWNIQNLNDGLYMIRAVAVTTNNETDPYPAPVWVEIGGNNSSSDPRMWPDEIGDTLPEGDRTVKKFYKTVADTVLLAHPTRNSSQDEIKIPANVLNNEIDQIQVTFTDTAKFDTYLTNAGFTSAGELRRIELRSGQTNFNDNVEVYISYQDDDNNGVVDNTLIKVQDLNPYYLNETDSKWYKVNASSVETDKKRVKCQTNHFTMFALGGVTTSNHVSNIVVYPNPFKPYDNDAKNGIPYGSGTYGTYTGGIVFDNVPANTKIRIYTILGELVDEFYSTGTNSVVWDAKNKSGREVASGMYIWLAEGLGGRKSGNVAVIR